MTLFFDKSRGRWKFDFRLGGVRFQGYCLDGAGEPVASKSAARQAEGVARRKASIAGKVADPRAVTIGQVVAALQPRWQQSATWPDRKRQARELLEFFKPSTPVRDIGADRIRAYTDFALARPIDIWIQGPGADDAAPAAAWKPSGRTRSPATVNRYLSLLRQILTRAGEMRDSDGRAVLDPVPTVTDLRELKRRARPMPKQGLQIAIDDLPPHAQDALMLTLYFGFRKSEVFRLEIHQVDFDANGIWLSAENVKDREDAFLPGAPAAMQLLRRLVDQARDRATTRLITYRRHPTSDKAGKWKPVAGARTSWKRVMDKIEIETGRRYRWHDIRAAFITHIALTAGPIAAQRMARHSDFETTQAYIDVADPVTRGAAKDAAKHPALREIRPAKVTNGSH